MSHDDDQGQLGCHLSRVSVSDRRFQEEEDVLDYETYVVIINL